MAPDNQALISHLNETKSKILQLDKSEIVQPCDHWKPKTDDEGKARALMARELKKGEHFVFKPIQYCKDDFLEYVLGSKINGIEDNSHSIVTEVVIGK